VKSANLREADLISLNDYYQNQIKVYAQNLFKKDQMLEASREKIHDELQKKNEMRKYFDLEISKLKSIIVELEL
jgi:hypothetical protein